MTRRGHRGGLFRGRPLIEVLPEILSNLNAPALADVDRGEPYRISEPERRQEQMPVRRLPDQPNRPRTVQPVRPVEAVRVPLRTPQETAQTIRDQIAESFRVPSSVPTQAERDLLGQYNPNPQIMRPAPVTMSMREVEENTEERIRRIYAERRERNQNEYRRRQEEMRGHRPSSDDSMTATIMLETGQNLQRDASNLMFFVYVTPTGAEVSLGKCPHLKRAWGRSEGGFEGSSRLQRTEYQVTSPLMLKMVNICTTFGSAKRTVNLIVELDPNAPAIEFTGLEGFGKFQGRARVNYKFSSYREHKTEHNLSDAVMKEIFGLRVLQPARAKGKTKVRSLIF